MYSLLSKMLALIRGQIQARNDSELFYFKNKTLEYVLSWMKRDNSIAKFLGSSATKRLMSSLTWLVLYFIAYFSLR